MLYLTPVFEGRSNHRYDAVSFDQVDPALGGDEALERLIVAAHQRGIRVLGDLTTNHTGSGHEWFLTAQADAASPEAGFYRFRHHPDDYVAWWDIPSLPKLDHANAELRARLYEGKGSIVARWLRAGLDGWRIDVANMTGRMGGDDLANDVARRIRATMQEVNPEAWLLAEHGHDASADLVGDGWDGTMDYQGFTRPVWVWLNAEGTTPEVATPPRSPTAWTSSASRSTSPSCPAPAPPGRCGTCTPGCPGRRSPPRRCTSTLTTLRGSGPSSVAARTAGSTPRAAAAPGTCSGSLSR